MDARSRKASQVGFWEHYSKTESAQWGSTIISLSFILLQKEKNVKGENFYVQILPHYFCNAEKRKQTFESGTV